jgi:hypothetical protein
MTPWVPPQEQMDAAQRLHKVASWALQVSLLQALLLQPAVHPAVRPDVDRSCCMQRFDMCAALLTADVPCEMPTTSSPASRTYKQMMRYAGPTTLRMPIITFPAHARVIYGGHRHVTII